MVDYLRPILQRTGARKLALAGGVFANVKLNQRLYELEEVDEIYIHPNMGDGGNAVGSALQLAHEAGENGSTAAMGDVYLGPSYSDGEIEAELRRRGLPLLAPRGHRGQDRRADRRAARWSVASTAAWSTGPGRWGTAASSPTPPIRPSTTSSTSRLHRTEFMPFAPSVLAEDTDDYFGISNGSRRAAEFMTITCDVEPSRREQIPAVTHVDGTARPQIVREETNPSYHRILTEFKKRDRAERDHQHQLQHPRAADRLHPRRCLHGLRAGLGGHAGDRQLPGRAVMRLARWEKVGTRFAGQADG